MDEDRAASAYWEITKFWQDGTGFSTSTRGVSTGNPIIDVINFLSDIGPFLDPRECECASLGTTVQYREVIGGAIGIDVGDEFARHRYPNPGFRN